MLAGLGVSGLGAFAIVSGIRDGVGNGAVSGAAPFFVAVLCPLLLAIGALLLFLGLKLLNGARWARYGVEILAWGSIPVSAYLIQLGMSSPMVWRDQELTELALTALPVLLLSALLRAPTVRKFLRRSRHHMNSLELL